MVGRLFMLLCLLGVCGYAFKSYMDTREANDAVRLTDADSVRATGLVDLAPKKLAANFTDNQGRLLADPPTDPSKLVDPSALVIGHLIESDADGPDLDWKQLDEHLSKITGKPVTDVEVENGPSQMDKIQSGQINIMALHGADAPFLVNNCGFQPIAVLGDETGAAGNHMDLLVKAGSSINSPADLKGKYLTCSDPLSIVGYRAAIVQLLQKYNLRPNVDYYVNWSQKQSKSVAGIADGTYECAAISDDKLQSMLAKHKIQPSQYKQIDQSEVFPRMAIGYFYNLKPELAAKVREAVLSYKPEATDTDEKPMHFIPVDYKKDFAVIRNIDDRFDPRLEPKASHKSATTSPVAELK